jgi:hypothetical protein
MVLLHTEARVDKRIHTSIKIPMEKSLLKKISVSQQQKQDSEN